MEDGLDRVEAGLVDQVAFTDEIANATSRYLLVAGGKRVRPTLTLLAAHLGEGNSDAVVAVAQAIEITHLASLYHDDVMDEAQMRRGVPSAQAVWGNSVAILTGDLLFARASTLVSGLGEPIIRLHAETFERLCLGQLHETLGPRDGEDPIEHYLQVLADKTGSLIAAAAQSGAMLSNAPAEFRGATHRLRREDRRRLPARRRRDRPGTGSRRDRQDAWHRPALGCLDPAAALPAPHRRDGSSTPATCSPASSVTCPTPTTVPHDDGELTAAIAELREHEVTRMTIAEAHRWADAAVAAIAPLPDGPVKKALTRFAESIVDRSS